ncbi:hypothetical protein [Nibribacter koreensis]|uniref:Uncharacterized protein n=1 Tax=Nibribacter koreensis TaxID=1084519 RepID=A0ABP8F5Q4_9BACT
MNNENPLLQISQLVESTAAMVALHSRRLEVYLKSTYDPMEVRQKRINHVRELESLHQKLVSVRHLLPQSLLSELLTIHALFMEDPELTGAIVEIRRKGVAFVPSKAGRTTLTITLY